MSSVNQEMFRKFKQLSTRQDGDGTEVEVREDEEQGVKLQEIIDLLVAAGYFRARIKGLSPFDKVVGGMTWCIESCSVDVDVDLLFQENSTIGQKIALTEKIVAVLPKLKCPHLIEPHQIQGLDFIHIFPVIQWLVKRSMEYRNEMSSFVRTYAVNQFRKDFTVTNRNVDRETNLLKVVNKVSEVYRPRRYYKRKTNPPEDLESRVQVTLLEYGAKPVTHSTKSSENEEVEDGALERFEQFLSSASDARDDYFQYHNLDTDDREKLAKHYASLKSEIEDGGLKSRKESKLYALEGQHKLITEHCNKIEEEVSKLGEQLNAETENFKLIRAKREDVEKSLQDLENAAETDPKSVQEVEELVKLNDSLRTQELQFREHCKQELNNLHTLIEETKKVKSPVISSDEYNKDLTEAGDKLKILRLQLAKKNRSIAALQRQLDDVPSRPELAQYQRRFLELYNQVAAKHKETKQYYTLYNTLEDTRQYMNREMSLLNSISDSYPEAMQSNSGKEEFLKQFESIVESVRQSKNKVDRRLSEEKHKRDQLGYKLQTLIDLQRRYATAVKQLSIECKRQENSESR